MKTVLVIGARDNVATALRPLEAGQIIEVGGVSVTVIETIAAGHKVALRRIACGDQVIKCDSPIGTSTVEIAAGAHVHTHNVVSGRGRGGVRLPTERPDDD